MGECVLGAEGPLGLGTTSGVPQMEQRGCEESGLTRAPQPQTPEAAAAFRCVYGLFLASTHWDSLFVLTRCC